MITTRETVESLLPGAKLIKLKGYFKNNDYQLAKRAVDRWQGSEDLTDSQVEEWESLGGWIGAVIPDDRVIVDIDDDETGSIVRDILEEFRLNHHAIKTPNGYQFIFKEPDSPEVRQIAKHFTSIGIQVDTRTAGKGYIVFPTIGTKDRYILTESEGGLAVLPRFLIPLKKASNQEIHFPIREQGSRNDTLYRFAACLRAWRVSPEGIEESLRIVYDFFVLDKRGFSFSELRSIVGSVLKWEPDFKEEYSVHIGGENRIPLPFRTKQGQLFKITIKKDHGVEYEDEKRVSRMTPHIVRELHDIEKNQVFYEISWLDQGDEKRQIVAASTISKKSELLKLADLGFSVNELNFKDIINYFDLYISTNRLERCLMSERLGWVHERFLHPLDSGATVIIPNGTSERQTLKAFQTKGSIESWRRQIFDRVKNHPKVLFLIFSSLASVLLRDLGVSSFIVDLSGSTSQGKTTALQVARSVWGGADLIGEWNLTRVSVERKAAFLNNFPLFLDDTRKADERILQSVVYQFSGGKAKGRGALVGGQEESTWNNILISTGEVSLTDFSDKAGGAAARIISLVDDPFACVSSDYFPKLYEALGSNYGVLGLSFCQSWIKHKEKYIPSFKQVRDFYIEKSLDDEVVRRMSLYFAAVHFAAAVFKEFFKMDFDLGFLEKLFDDITGATEALNKPRELMELILSDLDRSRSDILYDDDLFGASPKQIKAIFHHGALYLMPGYVKEELGVDNRLIRKEWIKRGYVLAKDDQRDTVVVRKGSSLHRGILVSGSILDELQYYFGRDPGVIQFPKPKRN